MNLTKVPICFLFCLAHIVLADNCRPSKLLDSVHLAFTKNNLRDIVKAATEIINLTNESDTLVFVGRSPLYIAESLKAWGVHRKIHRINFSYPELMPFRSEFLSYRRYLENNGITPESIIQAPGTVYLIDYTSSGHTIVAFAKILKAWAKEIDLSVDTVVSKLKIIAITNKPNNIIGNSSGFAAISIAMDSMTLDKITSLPEKFNLGAWYPPNAWNSGPPEENLSIKALELRRQVIEYSLAPD